MLALPLSQLEQFPGAALTNQGFWILLADASDGLKLLLEADGPRSADTLLLFVGARLAHSAAACLAALGLERQRKGLAPPGVVVIYEAGTLTSVPRPALATCNVIAIFEWPVGPADVNAATSHARAPA